MTEAEVWVLVAGAVLVLFSVIGFILQRATGRALNIFWYLEISGVIGLLLVGASFAVALVQGRLAQYVDVLIDAPLRLLASAGSERGYTSACVDGVCAKYCCEGVLDKTLKWRDCDEECNSIVGVGGQSTGASCQFDDTRQPHCLQTHTGGFINASLQMCNHLAELGPITCTCCTTATAGEKYWDCASDCSSYPSTTGFPANTGSCDNSTRLMCNGASSASSFNNSVTY